MLKHRSYFSEDVPDVVVRSLFTKYDTNDKGYLSQPDVRTFLCNDLGMTRGESDAVALLMDKDADTEISFEEFAHWLRNAGPIIKTNSKYHLLKQAAKYFINMDEDHNRCLDAEEVNHLLVTLGARLERSEEAFASMDSNGNGKITFDEFLHWLNWLPMEQWIYDD